MRVFWLGCTVIALLALISAYMVGGSTGILGMACGLFATTFSLVALWLMIRQAGQLAIRFPAPPVRYSLDNVEDTWTKFEEVPRQPNLPPPARKATSFATVLLVTTFFIKLPVFAVFALIAQRVGGAAMSAFAAGILLVYSAMVWWALARNR
jgi:hypothetical protein